MDQQHRGDGRGGSGRASMMGFLRERLLFGHGAADDAQRARLGFVLGEDARA
ncbi:hypothetical protein QEG98_32425 [Myxococcus sp. MxC21-1]|uniref:hypothetical protein n=1 Tax=Myxococcus sp. MxC21-1 TaxID=3041439 RepID=UPI00292D00C1|nr:hypothetical protein [Myxococcus sp. MxC21-1]WNZ60631.1 hypothetical protein QEG98_32425 [Myxococcus sp. MxC21-1]